MFGSIAYVKHNNIQRQHMKVQSFLVQSFLQVTQFTPVFLQKQNSALRCSDNQHKLVKQLVLHEESH